MNYLHLNDGYIQLERCDFRKEKTLGAYLNIITGFKLVQLGLSCQNLLLEARIQLPNYQADQVTQLL
ncbi:hypothetical protein TUMSATVNIG1_37960 [Vibrio nigripulchritudo]|nr:hypothetical protein VNTUMSATTG_37660 [Vibrio nigripulchritudo]BDU33187.1 hypothetical protein TUMSATVNIG1_37960 [Vibrio nigripulchritudo]BDU39236.1 hypothetical protein TUMSATVNIG2_37050 [Vibrio nigripulchritudo]BDU44956.1 hypothetical protein TUMSATVNIG3_37540 [Vibrio nigripulchritudo]